MMWLRQVSKQLNQKSRSKHTLVLVRHGESVWNRENKFTGWYDAELSPKGHAEAKAAGDLLKPFEFDVAFTSFLKRAIKTCWYVLEETNQMYIPVHKSWRLNERHYGALTGLDKAETVAKHGADQVQIWRRSYDIPPPEIAGKDSVYHPANSRQYASLDDSVLPKSESLATTSERVLPYWNDVICPEIRAGKRVLIAAHGNSLRALVKHLDGISQDDITGLNIPTGVPLVYELDEDTLMPISNTKGKLSGSYLGNQDEIQAKISSVAAQTSKKA